MRSRRAPALMLPVAATASSVCNCWNVTMTPVEGGMLKWYAPCEIGV